MVKKELKPNGFPDFPLPDPLDFGNRQWDFLQGNYGLTTNVHPGTNQVMFTHTGSSSTSYSASDLIK